MLCCVAQGDFSDPKPDAYAVAEVVAVGSGAVLFHAKTKRIDDQ